jgi:hypothetical protein
VLGVRGFRSCDGVNQSLDPTRWFVLALCACLAGKPEARPQFLTNYTTAKKTPRSLRRY